MIYEFSDAVPLSGARVTRDGYLVADAKIARTGIQEYLGLEVGKPDMKVVRIYRPEDEVFASDAMASFAHRPVTNDHPPEAVKAENWKRFSVGMTGDQVARDGGFIRVPLTLMDASAIELLKGGKRELSAGYECTLDWTPGVTADGEPYDAIQRGIRANHLALVDKARAGHECRIGDRKTNPAKKGKADMNDRKITVDGFTFDASEQAAQAIEKLMTKVADAESKYADASKALEAKDGELAAIKQTSDAKIAELTAKVEAFDASIDARIEERQSVLSDAKRILGKDVDGKGKTTAAIRREVVGNAMADSGIADRSDEYVLASFDTLAKFGGNGGDAIADAARSALGDKAKGGPSDPQAIRDAAYQEMIDRLNGRHNKDER